jgi:heterodisulfide reductase subunit A
LSKRKAIYRAFTQSVPAAFAIDPDSCTECGRCSEVCTSQAISLERGGETMHIVVGAIIIATGHEELNPEDRYDTGYRRYPEVMTQMELARLLAVNGPTNGKLHLNDKVPKRVVMVQCVGSRESRPGSVPYCSKVCCNVAIKHASYIMKHSPGTKVTICYTDIRAAGGYEDYYREAQELGVRFIRGRVGEVVKRQGQVLVRVEDTLGKGILGLQADLVVLSCAILPSEGTVEVAKVLGVNSTPELFVQETQPKLEPGSTSKRGIFVCGTACGAKDIGESIMQASTAAIHACELVLRDVEIRPEYALIDGDKCSSCGECAEACSTGAIFNDGSVAIDPMSCVGLGACVPKCPEHAITMIGSSDRELFGRIEGCIGSGSRKLIAFLDREIAYVAADNAGANHLKYSSSVRIISVPSVLRLEPKHLCYAFQKGAVGIFLGDGTAKAEGGMLQEKMRLHVEWLKSEVAKIGVDQRRIFFYEAYLPHYKGMVSRLECFNEELEGLGLMDLCALQNVNN